MPTSSQIDEDLQFVCIGNIPNGGAEITISSGLGACIAAAICRINVFINGDFLTPKESIIFNNIKLLIKISPQSIDELKLPSNKKILEDMSYNYVRMFNEDVRPYYEAMPNCYVKTEDELFEELKCLINSIVVKEILE